MMAHTELTLPELLRAESIGGSTAGGCWAGAAPLTVLGATTTGVAVTACGKSKVAVGAMTANLLSGWRLSLCAEASGAPAVDWPSAAGVAVMGAVMDASDPAAASRTLLEAAERM